MSKINLKIKNITGLFLGSVVLISNLTACNKTQNLNSTQNFTSSSIQAKSIQTKSIQANSLSESLPEIESLKIKIDNKNFKINLNFCNDNKSKIEYHLPNLPDGSLPKYTIKDDTLYINLDYKNKYKNLKTNDFFINISANFEENCFDDSKIILTNGDITILNYNIKDSEIKTTNGNITVTLNSQEALNSIDADMASLGWFVENKLSSTNGNITISGYNFASEFETKTVNGDIKFSDGQCSEAKFKTTNGNVDFNGNFTNNKNSISALNGNINVNLNSPISRYCYKIKNKFGNVYINSQKQKNSIENNVGSDYFEISLSNGDIKITDQPGENN